MPARRETLEGTQALFCVQSEENRKCLKLSRLGFITPRAVVGNPVAGDKMTAGYFAQARVLAAADVLGKRTTPCKAAAGRNVHRTRWIALQVDALAAAACLRVESRRSGPKRQRVGVKRPRKQRVAPGALHDADEISAAIVVEHSAAEAADRGRP